MGITVQAPARQYLWGYIWAALTVSIFAGWFVVTRFAVTHTLRPPDVVVLRFGIGILCLGPGLLRGPALPPRAWRNSAVFAILWGAPFVLLLGFGLQRTSTAEASAITPTLMPVFAGLVGWTFFRRRPHGMHLVGYVAIALGVLGLVVSIARATAMPDPAGLAALVGAAAMWAVYTILFRGSHLTALQSAALICLWSTLAYLPFYILFGLSRFPLALWSEIIGQAIYQGVLMSAVGIVTFNRAVALLGAGAATAIIALLPAIATAIAIPALGEVPDLVEVAAIAVIVAGVLLAAWPARRQGTRAG